MLASAARPLKATAEATEDMQQDEQTRRCLADLRLTDPRDDMQRIADIKGGLFEGASNWIFGHDDSVDGATPTIRGCYGSRATRARERPCS